MPSDKMSEVGWAVKSGCPNAFQNSVICCSVFLHRCYVIFFLLVGFRLVIWEIERLLTLCTEGPDILKGAVWS